MIMAPSPRSFLAFLLLAAGCDSTDSWSTSPCDVTLSHAKPEQAYVGETVTLRGHPLTSAYDTAVYLGTQRATVVELHRERCDDCDACLDDEGCTGCDDCDACDWLCSTCWEVVTIELPSHSAGDTTLRLFNRHGESNALDFEVLAAPIDTGADDTGSGDTSVDETGDTTPVDTASQDSGGQETGQVETGETGTDTDNAPNPDTDTP